MELLNYAREHFKELPADRWKGQSHSGLPIKVTDHKAGVDLSRGPWVKFAFTEGQAEREIQGYVTWKKGDRIKLDGKEADDDDVTFDASATGMPPDTSLNVIIKLSGETGGNNFKYRFEGKTN